MLLGDLNGDSVPDVAVGSQMDDDGQYNAGAVFIIFLTDQGTCLSFQKLSMLHGSFTASLGSSDSFGQAVSGGVDVDADDVPDLLVGAYLDDDYASDCGAIYIIFLSDQGICKSHQKLTFSHGGFTATATTSSVEFGSGVVFLNDLNEDGVHDIAASAYQDDTAAFDAGAVYVIFLSNQGLCLSHQKLTTAFGSFTGVLSAEDKFGTCIGTPGHIHPDSLETLAVGAFRDDEGGYEQGAIYIIFLTNQGIAGSHQKVNGVQGDFTGSLPLQSYFGVAVAGVGDLDNDDSRDLVVGACLMDSETGVVYLIFLTAMGTSKSHIRISSAEVEFTASLAAGDQFGRFAAGIGDVNDDGILDLVITSSRDSDVAFDTGAIYIVFLQGMFMLVSLL